MHGGCPLNYIVFFSIQPIAYKDMNTNAIYPEPLYHLCNLRISVDLGINQTHA